MKEINISADELVSKLLSLAETETVCLLDSCGVGHLGSHLLIAGINPLEISEITNADARETLEIFNAKLENNFACFYTIAYDLGLKLENVAPRTKELSTFPEPDVFIAAFDCVIIHNYDSGKTCLRGNENKFDQLQNIILCSDSFKPAKITSDVQVKSNFSKTEYIEKIEQIQEYIRQGDTYQTNLTQQFRIKLPKNLLPQQVFLNLRQNHPAPFASFIKRKNDCVVSISPERFFAVENDFIKTSPIKGTRPRGKNIAEDMELKNELLNSDKDIAENTMIVDLLRNDIGRVCEFGSVIVEKLCDLEEHPSLFHLVSTVSGELKEDTNYSEIVKALFPCGSITGCPKIRTMQIIDELETVNRGLSMGAIGYSIKNGKWNSENGESSRTSETSVAIRTLVFREDQAIFNVGGGIVIDSNPEDEYAESLLKAKALFEAFGIKNQ